MSLLTHKQILREVRRGRIHIEPFDPGRLNPNSYNLRLDSQLAVYKANYPIHRRHEQHFTMSGNYLPPTAVHVYPMDMAREEKVVSLSIPDHGLVLWPGVLYLGCTIETAGSEFFVPCVEGRSSVGRLGIQVHVTAGFGDLNFSAPSAPAQWTLELTVIHPIRIFAGVEIAQIIFTTPYQDADLGEPILYKGKYVGQRGPKPSGLWKDFLRREQHAAREPQEEDPQGLRS